MQAIAWKVRWVVESLMAFFLLSMVALTFFDVIGRRLFNKPIYGSNDITEHLMALVVFSGLPLVTLAGAHLTIDLFDKFLKSPAMAWWRALTTVLIAVIFATIAWLFVKHGINASKISEMSQALRIPRGPLYFFMAVSCGLSAMAALVIGITGPMIDVNDTPEEDVL